MCASKPISGAMMLIEREYIKRWHYSRFYIKEDILIKADWQLEAINCRARREDFCLLIIDLA